MSGADSDNTTPQSSNSPVIVIKDEGFQVDDAAHPFSPMTTVDGVLLCKRAKDGANYNYDCAQCYASYKHMSHFDTRERIDVGLPFRNVRFSVPIRVAKSIRSTEEQDQYIYDVAMQVYRLLVRHGWEKRLAKKFIEESTIGYVKIDPHSFLDIEWAWDPQTELPPAYSLDLRIGLRGTPHTHRLTYVGQGLLDYGVLLYLPNFYPEENRRFERDLLDKLDKAISKVGVATEVWQQVQKRGKDDFAVPLRHYVILVELFVTATAKHGKPEIKTLNDLPKSIAFSGKTYKLYHIGHHPEART